MKFPSLRGQLFAASLVILVITFFVIDSYLSQSIPSQIKGRLVSGLTREATLVATEASSLPAQDEAALDHLAGRMGESLGVRITLLGLTGTVLGDSEIPREELSTLESHRDRPEVRAALEGSVGIDERISHTTGQELLYVAVRYPDGRGVARVALPLSDSERELKDARWLLAVGTGVAAVFALAFATGASYLIGRSIRALTPVARAIAEGDFSRRAPEVAGDEVGELARALNRLSSDLERSLGAVRAERDLLDAVLEGMSEGVLVLDQVGRVARTNATLRAWLDLPGEVAGKLPYEIWPDRVLDQALFEARVKAQGQQLDLTLSTRKDRSLSVRVTPLSLGAGGGAVAVFYDVTEVRRLERVRRDFVTNVSHELRTPVSAIQGAAETLLDGIDSPEDGMRFASVIWRHANRLAAILSDLLELSRIESSGERLDKGAVSLAEVARDAVGAQEERIEARALQIVDELPADLPCAAADRRAVARVLGNLLENAVNYTEPRGAITLRGRASSAHVEVEVSDTGIGIEAQHLPRIFERFYRADAGRSRAQGGTGLGLAIVRHLVQGMGGEIEVESQPGKGSTFRVRLKRFSGHGPEKLASLA